MTAQTCTSYKERCYVQALHSVAGWSIRRIATALPLKKSTVARICQSPTTPKKRHYHLSSFPTLERKKLIDFITSSAATRQMLLKEVKTQMNLQHSVRSMQRALAREGYRRRIARKIPW
jgi:IS30 family transposase